MKQTIDHQLKELSDDGKGNHWFGFSINTVRKVINDIEINYFQGRKIYHGLTNADNNAIIFRYEIKGLLLLLLKIELEDVFRDDKSKDTGISSANVDKIIEIYSYALDKLSDYEYQVLMQFTDIEDGFYFLDSIKSFKDELTRLLIIIATKYHDHTANYYKMFIKRIKDISVSMIYGSHDLSFLNSKVFLQPLDLRKAIIKTINRISNDLYYYNDDKICRRSYYLPEQYKKLEEIYYDFYEIRIKHMYCPSIGDILKGEDTIDIDMQYELNSDDLRANEEDVLKIREELSDVLKKLYEQLYPLKPHEYVLIPSKEKVDNVLKTIKTALSEYILCFCKMQKFCYGKLSETEMKEIFNNESFLCEFYNRRFQLLHTELCDWSFARYLTAIEADLSRKLLTDEFPTQEEIETIVENCIKNYKEKVDKNAKIVRDEFSNLDDKEFLKREYNGIIDNINNIEVHCEALAKNLIAMILKRESDRDKDFIPF